VPVLIVQLLGVLVFVKVSKSALLRMVLLWSARREPI
jgi:hypothetical protein